MKMNDSIDIPITENDLELFKSLIYEGIEFDWVFDTKHGEQSITVNFVVGER